MTISTGSFAKALWPGVSAWYGQKYAEHTPEWKTIYEEKKSSGKAFEETVSVTGMGLATVKTEGNSIAYEDQEQGFIQRFTHITYAKGFIITREMYEDNQYASIGMDKATSLAFSMRQTDETVCANVLNRAFNSDYAGADGLELCSAAHLNKSGGTWRNELETAADLSEVSLEQAIIDLADFKNDKGLLIRVNPKRLVIPPELEFEAARILRSVKQNDSANNAINAIKSTGKIPGGYAVNHYLTDADAFFLITDCPNGMTKFTRRGHEFKNDNDFDTENAKFKASFRMSVGWSDPRGIFGSPGA